MWAEINNERKKVACGPCIRGHRSSKCDHRDRVLLEVRKPGRPLSTCPHPTGSCSCDRVVINYTIPKTSECACPSGRKQTVASASGSSARVQKNRRRKSTVTSALASVSIEKAIKANQEAETDSSSFVTSTPTNASFAPSERSISNAASPPSSASSTPRLQPSPSRKESHGSDIRLPDAPASSESPQVSSCCKPKPAPSTNAVVQQQGGGGCCSGTANKIQEAPKPAIEKKSCCSGSTQPTQQDAFIQPVAQPNFGQQFNQYPQFPHQGQYQTPPFGGMHQSFGFNMSTNMGMPVPYGFNTPIYNHMAFQQHAPSMPMAQTVEHNCQCGDSCSCFGCAAHPHNATMTEYLRTMHQYMNTGGFGSFPAPTYDLPTYPHQPGFGAEANQSMAFNSTPHPQPFSPLPSGHLPFDGNISSMMGVPNAPVDLANPWAQQGSSTPLQTPPVAGSQYDMQPKPQEPCPPMKTEDSTSSPAFLDSPSEGKDEETPTLSPSSYFWQELVLPGCDDATGTCQCGDGCECVGCLTHGGHNGVPLEDPIATTGAEDFSNFLMS